MSAIRSTLSTALFILSMAIFAGCGGSGLELAPVRGKVMLGDVPVSAGKITFTPELGPAAVADLNASGEFELKTGDELGAVVGSHKITITPKIGGVILQPGKPPAAGAITAVKIPKQFQAIGTTTLSREVSASGENNFTLDLAP